MSTLSHAPAVTAPVGTRRLLAAPGPSLAEHLATYGPLPADVDLLAVVEAAGLLGHGGAGFPSARKLRAVRDSGPGIVVGNGAEGEPASDKDRTLLEHAPHLVVDGLVLAAEAVGAREAHLVTARPEVARQLREQVARRSERLRVHVVEVPDRFVAGEESAVVNAVNGRAAVPSDRAVRVFERGVGRRPTLVHNVETLAHLALLARFGPGWFGALGTADEPGTLLTTVSGAVRSPQVLEVPYGIPLSDLLDRAGGSAATARAVLVGGYHGAWVPGERIAVTRLSRGSLAPYGATVGAGVVAVLGRDRCGLVESAGVVDYLAGQVAGQCGPCVNGLPAMAAALGRLARGERSPGLVGEIDRLRGLVVGRGACTHPDGTSRFVASSLRVFADEVSVHLGGGCSATPAR